MTKFPSFLTAISLVLMAITGVQAQTILYICGNQKGNAGEAFDHGLIGYIESQYTGSTVTPTLSDEIEGTSPQGLYDPDNPTVIQSHNFADFDCVVLSSTVSTHYVPLLMTQLRDTTTNLLVLSEESLVELRMVENTVNFAIVDSVFDGSAQVQVTNFPGNAVLSFGDYYPEADVNAWENATANTNGTDGFFFSYTEGTVVDSGIDEFTLPGDRVFLGLSEGENVPASPSGVWEDQAPFNGVVDAAEDFDPNTDLTAAGKTMLDQALGLHVVPEPGTATLSLLTILLVGSRRRR